jgi:hypothetical protein
MAWRTGSDKSRTIGNPLHRCTVSCFAPYTLESTDVKNTAPLLVLFCKGQRMTLPLTDLPEIERQFHLLHVATNADGTRTYDVQSPRKGTK